MTAIGDRLNFITGVPFEERPRRAAALEKSDDRPDCGGCDWRGGEELASTLPAGQAGRRSHPRQGVLSAREGVEVGLRAGESSKGHAKTRATSTRLLFKSVLVEINDAPVLMTGSIRKAPNGSNQPET
jgi:hypothetical protein